MSSLSVARGIIMVVGTLLFSNGFLDGWNYSREIFISEGYFNNCNSQNETMNMTSCVNQLQNLDYLYVISSQTVLLMCIIGYYLDFCSTARAENVLLTIMSIALIGIAIVDASTSNVLYFMIPCITITAYSSYLIKILRCKTYKNYSSTVVGLVTGAFLSSKIVLMLIYYFYQKGSDFNISLIVLIISIVIFILPVYVLSDSGTIQVFHDDLPDKLALPNQNSVGSVIRFDRQQILARSSLFWTNAVHFSLIQMCLSYFVSDHHNQIFLSSGSTGEYLRFFTGAGKLSSLFYGFIAGLLIDLVKHYLIKTQNKTTATVKSISFVFLICDLVVILLLILSLFPQAGTILAAYALCDLAKSFLYTTTAAYILSCYPTTKFGFFYGLTLSIGAASHIGLIPLKMLFGDTDSSNSLAQTSVLLGLSLLASIHTILMFVKEPKLHFST